MKKNSTKIHVFVGAALINFEGLVSVCVFDFLTLLQITLVSYMWDIPICLFI